MEVYVIKHLDTNNVVAVIEAQPDVSDEQALIHWLASCGLTEKAASQFRCIFSPVIPWASLAKMFEPIVGDSLPVSYRTPAISHNRQITK